MLTLIRTNDDDGAFLLGDAVCLVGLPVASVVWLGEGQLLLEEGTELTTTHKKEHPHRPSCRRCGGRWKGRWKAEGSRRAREQGGRKSLFVWRS